MATAIALFLPQSFQGVACTIGRGAADAQLTRTSTANADVYIS